MVLAGIGRYGPYVQHGSTYANLPDAEEVFDIGLNRAVTVLAEKRAAGPGRGRAGPTALKDLGAHPTTGEAVKVLSGRYGPYVASGGVNANIPKGGDPASVTLEQAVELLAARAGKAPKGKTRRAPAKKAAPKKTAAKAKTSKPKAAKT
jgi:DNA topoisomerase-1